MMKVRQLIFDVAKKYPEVGKLEETLRWGEPSYVTSETEQALDLQSELIGRNQPLKHFMYFSIVEQHWLKTSEKNTGVFSFETNRSIVLHGKSKIPTKELSFENYGQNIRENEESDKYPE